MSRSSVVYVILLTLAFGFGAAQIPSQAPAHPPISHHAPSHSVNPPAHAPSPMTTKTPPAASPSPVVFHSPPTKSPVVATPPSPISVPPFAAPAPVKNAADSNIFSTACSLAVGVFAAVLIN